MSELTDLILGTAGHIDHGKTSLIRAVTGVETDRLPEEKKRGITIELGYAHLDLDPFRLGIVDVPGHEKFVRQMLAGATGMDLALLAVAGDDSIKQQTREHLDILRMLDLPAGVIVITKCDLCEPDWLELVEDEIRQLVSDTFLRDAPIIRASSHTGEGIEDVKSALKSAAEKAAASGIAQRQNAPFRMAIDRSFAIEGHGTVVTGSVNSGRIAVGDQLEVQPGSTSVRVRGIQNHDESSDRAHRGQRAAINIAGVHHLEIERGHELAAVGHLKPSRLLTVKIHVLSQMKKAVRDRTRVRFHVGTAELFGNIRLLGTDAIEPGESGLAQVYLNEEAVTVWNQPFVIRLQSPVVTIGGGRVLHPSAAALKKPTEQQLSFVEAMSSGSPDERAAASIYLANDTGWTRGDWPRTAGVVDVDETYERLVASGEIKEIAISQTRRIVLQQEQLAELSDRVVKTLTRLHEAFPLRFNHPRNVLEVEFAYLEQKELLSAAIDHLKKEKKVFANVNTIALVGSGPKLSKGQKELLGDLIVQLKAAGLKTPNLKELQASAKKNKDSVAELLTLACENGDLVKVDDDMYVHAGVLDEAKEKLRTALTEQGGLAMTDIRQILDTSRKYAVPVCEYLDRIEFTLRQGDQRVLGPGA
jgi:selenocysteine-specific elongation factor